jgi:galactose-1-phosphate uridylyltransferase
MPYMLWFHQRPFDGGAWPSAHVHAEIAVPQRAPGVHRFIAGGELGSGLYVNPVVPESAAAELRAVKW